MWAALRRILNRPTTPTTAGNQRPYRRSGPQRHRSNQGPFVGIYRTAGCVSASSISTGLAGNAVSNSNSVTTSNNTTGTASASSAHRMTSAGSPAVPLRPWHLRNRRFGIRWRGLDPVEVHTFLNQAATDLAAVYAQLANAREETQRIKDALRQWQSEQAPTAYDLAGHR